MPLITAWPLLAPLAAALLLALRPRTSARASAWLAGLALLSVLAALLAVLPQTLAGEVQRLHWDWFPALGLSLSIRIDALAWMYAAMVSAIGALVVLYARYYLSADEPAARFYACLLLFAAAMLGLVCAGNLLWLAICWELTSLCSFLLVGHWNDQSAARRGARMALWVTGSGGLALLAGILWLGQVVGTLDLDGVLAAGDQLRASPDYPWILALILIGAFSKSAQFPLHGWLPQAMAAPTPVSAFLHSATLVKAGVFLLARLYPVLSGTDEWLIWVGGTGLITLLLGSGLAVFQHDLKGLLAYSTISHLGLITLLLGLESPLTVVAALFHVMNHATFKASLFMAAGIIDHETGTRDMRRLHGLIRHLPWTGGLAIIAASAMAGVPLLNGFLSKEMFFAETLRTAEAGGLAWLIPAGALLAAVFAVAYSTRFVHDVFFGKALTELAHVPHEPPRWMKVPVEVLVLLCVLVGTLPALTIGPLLHAASTAALGAAPPPYSLALWHGFNGPLGMSVLALLLGLALYLALYRRQRLHHWQLPVWSAAAYAAAVAALIGLARRLSALNPDRLQWDLRVLWLVTIALVAGSAGYGWGGERPTVPAPGPALVALMLAALLWALLRGHRQRLNALMWIGGVGLSVSLGFVYWSAPDLALTQVLVEIVSVLLLLMVLPHLPAAAGATRRVPWLDVTLALTVGAGMTMLMLAMLSQPSRSIADYFLAQALPGAGGSNAVNVIIVDFRGLDTLGEMTVFAVAALAVRALLAPRATAPRALRTDAHPPLLAVGARWLLPLALLLALHLLIRGHNEPGGGFIAGLVVAVAIALQRLTLGLPADPGRAGRLCERLMAAGLGLGALTALAPLLLGYPVLTSYYQYLPLPLLGKLPLASVFLFDLGVFLVVAAGTTLMLDALAGARTRAEAG